MWIKSGTNVAGETSWGVHYPRPIPIREGTQALPLHTVCTVWHETRPTTTRPRPTYAPAPPPCRPRMQNSMHCHNMTCRSVGGFLPRYAFCLAGVARCPTCAGHTRSGIVVVLCACMCAWACSCAIYSHANRKEWQTNPNGAASQAARQQASQITLPLAAMMAVPAALASLPAPAGSTMCAGWQGQHGATTSSGVQARVGLHVQHCPRTECACFVNPWLGAVCRAWQAGCMAVGVVTLLAGISALTQHRVEGVCSRGNQRQPQIVLKPLSRLAKHLSAVIAVAMMRGEDEVAVCGSYRGGDGLGVWGAGCSAG